MQFFGIGLFELVMIMVVALLVVGPDRLPQTAREIGKVVRELRRYAFNVREEIKEGFGELTSEVEATRGEFTELGRSLKSSGLEIERELKETSDAAGQGEFVDSENAPRTAARKRSSNGSRGSASRRPQSPVSDSDSES
ncbi:MAG TPA: Sec-independent protein translocase protein TatB [Dehalococcoidia bacterium]|nr:Sec-independent protein translocase protein TatB [Dehalococcoidia bacterium]